MNNLISNILQLTDSIVQRTQNIYHFVIWCILCQIWYFLLVRSHIKESLQSNIKYNNYIVQVRFWKIQVTLLYYNMHICMSMMSCEVKQNLMLRLYLFKYANIINLITMHTGGVLTFKDTTFCGFLQNLENLIFIFKIIRLYSFTAYYHICDCLCENPPC